MNTAKVRSVTEKLYTSIMLDIFPNSPAVLCDFGLDGWGGSNIQMCYEALYYPIRNGEITIEELDAALGNGPALSELVNKCPHNPHKGIHFHTAYDTMDEEDEPTPSCNYCRTGEGSSCDCV